MRWLFLILVPFLLAACVERQNDGVIDVVFIGDSEDPFENGLRLSQTAQHIRASTRQGLVSMAVGGEIVPAIAERWIVTDDGVSYIFRVREFDLRDGSRLTAQSVHQALEANFAALDGTSMGLDLAKVRDIRAMTGRVIEIRLKSPMPGFLRLLAQPEMGLQLAQTSTGPMRFTREEDAAVLDALPPEVRGLPQQADWADEVLQVRLVAQDAEQAVDGFNNGSFELVLGGTVADLPLADTGALTRGTVRLDSAMGLFGLDIVRPTGFLGQTENREALALALDREALIQPFNIAGWIPTTRLVAPGLPGDRGLVTERWDDLELEERRAAASARVSRWLTANPSEARASENRGENGTSLPLSVYLPEGPGSDILFAGLRNQYSTIGVNLTRAREPEQADLRLRDRIARFGGSRWFLNQFHCDLSERQCSQDVDFLVQLAVETSDPAEAASYLEEAETALTATNPFIPIGAPIRWSMVRADVDAFSENPWNVHPLFPLTRAPI
jgi:ABC-type transport system substrate-binding protein